MLESVESLNNQAVIFASKGDFREAIACLKKAITFDKKNHHLWFNLALTYRDAGEFPKAKSAMEQAWKIAPQNEEIIESMAVLCFSMGNMEESLFYCANGLEVNCYNAHFWNTTGVVFFNLEDYEKASDFFEHAVVLDPNYYDAVYNLRDTYEELGNKSGVEECNRKMKMFERECKK